MPVKDQQPSTTVVAVLTGCCDISSSRAYWSALSVGLPELALTLGPPQHKCCRSAHPRPVLCSWLGAKVLICSLQT